MPVRCRLRDSGRALCHEEQHAVVRLGEVGEVQPAVARVVEPRHRRVVAAHHHLAQRLEAGLHVLQRPAEECVVLGQVGEELHRHLGDEAERALVADHDVADVGAGGAARDVLDPRHLATREDDLEPDDHVLDAAVERRELADAAGGDETAHVRDRLRLRRVPRREAELAHAILEHLQRHAALARRLHVVRVDVDDPIHLRAVEHDRVGNDRLEAALGRGAARPWHDVDSLPLREREHLRRLPCVAHHRHRRGRRERVDAEDVLQLAEVVDAPLLEQQLVGSHVLGAQDLLQTLDDLCSGQFHGGVLWGCRLSGRSETSARGADRWRP